MSRIADFGALQICLNLLSELETGIEARGFADEHDIPVLSRLYGRCDVKHCESSLCKWYLEYSIMASVPDDVRKQRGYFLSL
jgi:hypothetical protein